MTAEVVKVPEAPDSVAEQQRSSPPTPNKAGGDEAAGSPGASVNGVPEEKDALSSPDDDSSNDESQDGDGLTTPRELPVDSHFPQWRTLGRQLRKKGGSSRRLRHLACRLKG